MFSILRESGPHEARVAATPETVARMVQNGAAVRVQAGAGAGACFADADYAAAGATVMAESAAVLDGAQAVLKVAPPSPEEARALPRGCVLVAFLEPTRNLASVRALAEAQVSVFAMDLVPRITRAQKMDALSSQANVAGYKAVLLAAAQLPRYFPLLMTAAGTVKPAKVLVFGVGVAGLQAIATARRLGAVVEATDIRAETKEQVESLGARFLLVEGGQEGSDESGGYAKEASDDYRRRQAELVGKHLAEADVVITTAQVPGRQAPVLVTADMVRSMRAGSVIVDLAASQGGNCELTRAGETVVAHGVSILGPPNLPATVAANASELYSRNVLAAVTHLWPGQELVLDLLDEITDGSLAVHAGEVRHGATAEALQSGAAS
ncbi:MAG TPA: Re/Si-specific NAD(P)(+) transhydrogenase subunit alpha [Planctomycetota bacterium]